jgi:hypothetical protein
MTVGTDDSYNMNVDLKSLLMIKVRFKTVENQSTSDLINITRHEPWHLCI